MEEEDNSAMNYSVLRQTIQHVLHSSLFGGSLQLRLLWLIRTTLRRHLFTKPVRVEGINNGRGLPFSIRYISRTELKFQ